MNRRLHHVLPPDSGDEPVVLLDFPVQKFEVGEIREHELEELLPILECSTKDAAASLCAAFSKCDSPLARMLATSVTPLNLVIWKGEAWIECRFQQQLSPERIALLLLKFPLQVSHHIPSDWPAEEQKLIRVLSGLREDYPPSGGEFWDGRSPVTFFRLDTSKEQFPEDALPGQLIFTAHNGDLIVRESDGRYVWWRSACSERILLARNAVEFEAGLLSHFAHDWVIRNGSEVLWPFDGFGPPS